MCFGPPPLSHGLVSDGVQLYMIVGYFVMKVLVAGFLKGYYDDKVYFAYFKVYYDDLVYLGKAFVKHRRYHDDFVYTKGYNDDKGYFVYFKVYHNDLFYLKYRFLNHFKAYHDDLFYFKNRFLKHFQGYHDDLVYIELVMFFEQHEGYRLVKAFVLNVWLRAACSTGYAFCAVCSLRLFGDGYKEGRLECELCWLSGYEVIG